MKRLLLLLFTIHCSLFTAQINYCGYDELKANLLTSNAFLRQKEEQLNKLVYDRTVAASSHARLPLVTYTIPLVVHIIHNNGPENLSDATVIAAVNQMNLRFQNAAPYYDSTGHEVGIQFCLASVDPAGNPTTGITRNVSTLTNLNGSYDLDMKNLNRWDPLYYYNVWVVNFIWGFSSSVAGYSSLPSNLGDDIDGVVIDHNSMMGTNNVLTHESGHYLGLQHTWLGGCHNDNCLLDGDYVCDTPPDTSTSVCRGNSCSSDMNDTSGFNPFTMDMDDLPNYMDYTPCPLSFSQGQAERMNYFLSAVRFQLLSSIGCGFTGGPAPTADFTDTIEACYTGNVTFSDTLCTHTNTVSWDFDNNGTYDSYSHNPTYTYPATGTYTVKLKVAGPGGVDSVYHTIFVMKATSPYYPIIMNGGLFQYPAGVWKTCVGYSNYFTAPAHAQSYLWSTGDTSRTIMLTPTSTYNLTLTMVDSMGLTWNSAVCTPLTVNVLTPPDTAMIFATSSLDICEGDTIVLHSIMPADTSVVYTWYQNGGAGTGIHDSLFTAIGFAYGVQYQIVGDNYSGCYSWSNVLYVNAYNPPAMQSLTQVGMQLISGWGGGNQWYMNGVPIAGATGTTYNVTQSGCYQVAWYFSWAPQCTTMSDTICYINVGINEQGESNRINVFPNPSSTSITVTSTDKLESIRLFNTLGEEILNATPNSNQCTININQFDKGVYFAEIKTEKGIARKKVVKE